MGQESSQVRDHGTRPLISVVIPVGQEVSWFSEALESVFAQSYKNFEVICFVDGENRAAENILDRFAGRMDVVRSVKSMGAAFGRNSAILRASGELVACLDCDDYWPRDHLSHLADLFASDSNLVMAGTDSIKVNALGMQLSRIRTAPQRAIKIRLPFRNAFVHSSVVFRRELGIRVGLYREGLSPFYDYDLWLRLARKGRVANLRGNHVGYRVHDFQESRVVPTRFAFVKLQESKLGLARSAKVPSIAVRFSHTMFVALFLSKSSFRKVSDSRSLVTHDN